VGRRKIGSVLLSGLIIGPILGSGIIILPPVIYSVAGDMAILSWAVMMLVSFLFATVFGWLAMKFPGDAGVATAVCKAFGIHIKRLMSLYLVCAVCFGPVAVMLAASDFMLAVYDVPISSKVIAYLLLLVCYVILLHDVRLLGKIVLVISSIAVVILTLGSLVSLIFHRKAELVTTLCSPTEFGYSLMLVFWVIVGWEVIGNYGADVQDPSKTIPRATAISAVTICLVSLVVAAGTQWMDASDFPHDPMLTVTALVYPLFGSYSDMVMAVVAGGLCLAAFLMFIGGVSRLVVSMADDGFLPKVFGTRRTNGAPGGGVLLMFCLHSMTFMFVWLEILDLEKLVALADGFLLANALLGILAAMKITRYRGMKIVTVILAVFFGIVLLFANPFDLFVIIVMGVWFGRKQFNKNRLGLGDRVPCS
jgi:amino acid transporter